MNGVIVPLSDDRLLVAHRGQLALVREHKTTVQTFPVSEGTLVRLVLGGDGYFAVKHHRFAEPPVRIITAHHATDPETASARLTIDDEWQVAGTGDSTVWSHLPALFDLVYPYILRFTADSSSILKLPGIPNEPETPDDPYRTVPCPGSRHAIVTQTRGGRFVVYDLEEALAVADVTVGTGTPIFRFHPRTNAAWLARHDTIVRFDPSWNLAGMARIRDTVRGSTISDMAFDAEGTRLAVAYSERRPVPLIQPYRLAPVDGGVMVIDVDEMKVVGGVETDRWVDEIAFLADGRLALRERDGGLEIRFVDIGPVDWKLHPPRPDGEEWL